MSTSNDSATQQQGIKQQNKKKYELTSPHFKPRYTGPPLEEMTPEQKSLRASILKSRPRTGLSGPFAPWLAIPAIAQPSQELGRMCRYETSLSIRESELVILLTGAKFKSEAEFDIHVTEARRAGVGWDVIQSIPRGVLLSKQGKCEEDAGEDDTTPEFSLAKVKECVIPLLEKEHDDDTLQLKTDEERNRAKVREIAIVLFTAELLDKNSVSDESYAATKKTMDGKDSVLVEIVAITGYYAYVAFTLNTFNIASSVTLPE